MKNSATLAIPANLTTSSANLKVDVAPLVFAPIAKMLGATALSTVAGWCVTAMVSFCFDWGYETVKQLCGQPESLQGVIAAMSLWFLVLPFSFSLTFGYLKQAFNGARYWSLLPGIAVAGCAVVDFLIDADWSAVIEMTPWVAVAIAFAYAGYFTGQRVMKSLKTQSDRRLIAAGLAACAPAGLLMLLSVNLNYKLEIALTIATLLSATTFVAARTREDKLSERLHMVVLAMLPIIFPLTINLFGTNISAFLDTFSCGADIGWRAVVSALTLFNVVTANCLAGAILGHVFKNRQTLPSGSRLIDE